MMKTVGHHLYFMMLCVGTADGNLSDKEEEACKTRAQEQVARLCQRDGWDKYGDIVKKEQDIVNEAYEHYRTVPSLWVSFEESVKMMPPSLNHDQAMLNDLYDALKSVAEADGGIVEGEITAIEFAYAEWGLGG